MWVVRAVLIAVLIIALIAFAFNNFGPDQKVDVNLGPFYHDYTDVPLVTVVFWGFVGGVVLAMILFIGSYINLSVQLRTERRKVRALEQELSVLRNRPIEESAELLKGVDARNRDADTAFGEGSVK